MTDQEIRDYAAATYEQHCRAQGVDPVLTDPVALETLAILCDPDNEQERSA